jgi:hypothetical protein
MYSLVLVLVVVAVVVGVCCCCCNDRECLTRLLKDNVSGKLGGVVLYQVSLFLVLQEEVV